MPIYRFLTRVLYGLASLSLTGISLAMIAVAGFDVWQADQAGEPLKRAMLDGIGLIVVSLAVFDVAKYLMEEEVLRDRELRSPSEARKTLTKFFVIIIIAVTLEALVFVLGAASQDLSLLIYPALLLGTASLMLVSLALYLRLSSHAEGRLSDPNRSDPDPSHPDRSRPAGE